MIKKIIDNYLKKNSFRDPWDIVDSFEKKLHYFLVANMPCVDVVQMQFLSLKYFKSKKNNYSRKYIHLCFVNYKSCKL